MNYDGIDVDAVVAEVEQAIEQGDYRQATEQERERLRLAVLAYEETAGKNRCLDNA